MNDIHPSERHGASQTVLNTLLVFIVTAALFWPSVHFGYINLDDPQYVHHNPHVLGGLTSDGIREAFGVFNDEYWLPTLFLSLMANVQLFGTGAGGFHLVNVLLHAANAALVFLLLKGATRRHWPSLIAALLFALHPLRVESVIWVSQRKDVLSTLFILLALATWYRYTVATSRGSRFRWYGTTILFLLLGLTTKPMMVTFPLLLLVLDVWPLGRCSFAAEGTGRWLPWSRRHLAEKVPLLFLCIVFAAVTVFNQRSHLLLGPDEPGPAGALLTAPLSYLVYLVKMVLPVDLGLEFRNPASTLPWHRGLAALALHGVLLAAIWRMRTRWPFLLAGWVWYLVALLPVSGIVPVGLQWLSDRFTYVPLLGVTVALVWWGSSAVPSPVHGKVAVAITMVGLFGYLAATRHQLGYWENSTSLFARSVRLDPGNARARYVFGAALARDNRTDEALSAMESAVRLAPEDPLSLQGLGSVLADMGRHGEAIALFERAAALSPRSVSARRDLMKVRAVMGDLDGAARDLRILLGLVRSEREASLIHSELGRLFWEHGSRDEALSHFEKAARLASGDTKPLYDLAVALLKSGKGQRAAEAFAELVRSNNKDPMAHLGLAESLAAAGDKTGALSRFEESARLFAGDAAGYYALGRMAELSGNREGAREEYRKGLKAGSGPPDLRRSLEEALAAADQPQGE